MNQEFNFLFLENYKLTTMLNSKFLAAQIDTFIMSFGSGETFFEKLIFFSSLAHPDHYGFSFVPVAFLELIDLLFFLDR